jgi:phosphohistidine phosphatase
MRRLYLVHHADAVGPDVDPQRPLSSRGLAQAAAVAAHAHEQGVKPDAIWHSGKLRAKQTAEAIYRACNPFAEFRLVAGLRPDDSPRQIIEALIGETRDVVLVSHMPLLPALAEALVPGPASMPLNGMIALQRESDEDEWTVEWRYMPSLF